MTGIVCSLVGATFSVAAAAQVLRAKKGITAVGNAQIDTAQSKFGGSSALFDGTGDYLTVADSQTIIPTSDNWTVECWVYQTSRAAYSSPFCWGSNVPGGSFVPYRIGMQLTVGSSGHLFLMRNLAGTDWGVYITLGSVPSLNAWHHYAVVRNGTTITVYIDGVSSGTGTYSGNLYSPANDNFQIGWSTTSDSYVTGNIDEFRISNSARYTSNFTPSTTPFVNDANTLLLLHMNGTDASTFFEDDNGVRMQSGLESTSTVVTSTTQSKFGGSSVYFPETSGQYLNAYYSPQTMGLTNNGDFTIEAWVYFTKAPNLGDSGYMMLYSHSPEPYVLFNANQVALGAGGYPTFTRAGSANWATNTWYHIAVSRSSGNLRVFENGTQIGSTVTGSTYNYIPYTDNLGTRFGKFGDDRGRWQGYMDEIRFSKVARYTANFTAPTAPFVNDADTLLLIHCDGTNSARVFRDDNGTGRSQVGLVSNSSAQISTAQSKFGGSSALFARSAPNDWVKTSDSSVFSLENYSSWTIEFWLRFANNQSDNFPISTSDDKFNMRIQSGGSCNFNTQGSSPAWTKTHTVGTWYHYAIVKDSGGTVTVYLDGTSVATGNVGGTTPSSRSFYIGDRFDTGYCMDGYIDEFRISSTARYTANFTPSTTPFQNDSNTLLLMHMDGTNGSTVFTDDNGIAPYTP